MEEYGHFLTRRFIVPYFSKGSKEFHMLFDNPGEVHAIQSHSNKQEETHLFQVTTCAGYFSDTEVPKKMK